MISLAGAESKWIPQSLPHVGPSKVAVNHSLTGIHSTGRPGRRIVFFGDAHVALWSVSKIPPPNALRGVSDPTF